MSRNLYFYPCGGYLAHPFGFLIQNAWNCAVLVHPSKFWRQNITKHLTILSFSQSNQPCANLCYQPMPSKELYCFKEEHQLIGHVSSNKLYFQK